MMVEYGNTMGQFGRYKQVAVRAKALVLGALLVGALSVTSAPVIASPLWLAEVSGAQAAERVAKKTGGKVLKVTEEERGGVLVYRVKVLLPEGRVKTVFVNKETGGIGG